MRKQRQKCKQIKLAYVIYTFLALKISKNMENDEILSFLLHNNLPQICIPRIRPFQHRSQVGRAV